MTTTTISHAHVPQQHTDPRDQREESIDLTADLGTGTIGWTELETVDQMRRVEALTEVGIETWWAELDEFGAPKVVTTKDGKVRPAARNAVTISWRVSVWEFVKGETVTIHLGRDGVAPTRVIAKVWLRNRATGVVVRFIESHWNSGVQPFFKPPADYRRKSLATSIAKLTRALGEGKAPTIVSLDANTTRLPSLVEVPGLVWETTKATHGARQIDWVGTRGGLLSTVMVDVQKVRVRAVKFLDHKATVATFRLTSSDDHQEPDMPDDRYEKVKHDGKTVDRWTAAALREAERRLGYPLTIVQGSYNRGVGASAGTHDGGGVVDLAAFEADRKVRVLREVGFAAWRRRPSQGPWNEHVHAVLIGNERAADSAKRQVTAYRNGRNGLANNGPDDGPRVGVHTFAYPPKAPPAPPAPAPTPAKPGEFERLWIITNRIATNPRRSKAKRAAAAAARAALAPFVPKSKRKGA